MARRAPRPISSSGAGAGIELRDTSPTAATTPALSRLFSGRLVKMTDSPLAQYLTSIPELQLARGQFLYSSLPSRKEVNPTGYSGAINWWETTLANVVAKGLISEHKLILVADENLREGLRYGKLGRPASLGGVLVSPS